MDKPMDLKQSVFLPKTDFAMRANLAKKEPDLLKFWEQIGLYKKLREQSKDRETFVLHDGPPFANGHIHLGTALNKILKDVVVKLHQMHGKNANYVPGWDCHGLPIEWKIEEKYRKAGKDKDAVPAIKFRRECREFANKWIDIQREEFKRLGVIGNWDDPYMTMAYKSEAAIYRELSKFVMEGKVYKGFKPVMWSVIEKTALADAEIEYKDKQSKSIYVKFPIVETKDDALKGAFAVIWTTTPWTIPGNRAIAYGDEIDYVLFEANQNKYIVAECLLNSFVKTNDLSAPNILKKYKGSELEGVICHHPLHGQGYDFDVPFLSGHHVTTEQGTGLVHTAPGHGEDDFILGKKFNLEVPQTVGEGGVFYDYVPLFAGQHVYKADVAVIEALEKAERLLSQGTITHSYPHSWRSKAPLIFRTVPQWFINVKDSGIQERAIKEIDNTKWIPTQGRNRIYSMVASRPDWNISRQRVWGVPLAIFVHKKTGEILKDPKILDRIYKAFVEEGSDIWFGDNYGRFLEPDYSLDDYEPIKDIIDVWFESGTTHRFVLEDREDLSWPADLYLEGSDQHRGWFQSSLLVACRKDQAAPYKAVLTHGFIVDEHGRKMSKSVGNTIAPPDVINKYGADILRLWLVGTNYTEDIRSGDEILKHHSDLYRRFRNTLRFVLGNLSEFDESEKLDYAELPELERWVLHQIYIFDQKLKSTLENYDLHTLYGELHNFCALDLSAFYFDIRKDSLYCDAKDSMKRRATRTVLDIVFNHLTAWFAPVLSYTAEEAWLARFPEKRESGDSIHLQQIPNVPQEWQNDALNQKWNEIRKIRNVVTGAMEIERANKRIGSSLQARPRVYLNEHHRSLVNGLDLAEIVISSDINIQTGFTNGEAFKLKDVPDVSVIVDMAEGDKCDRCWRVLPEVKQQEYGNVCKRCDEVVSSQ
jgi:isoleucyl-tRNA synthetase